MPNCFQLLRDGAAVPLSEIDQEMCRHFEEHCDPEVYFRDWYSSIGYDLAMGRSFEQIEAIYAIPEWAESGLLPVVQWLRANFTPSSWYERRATPGAAPGTATPDARRDGGDPDGTVPT